MIECRVCSTVYQSYRLPTRQAHRSSVHELQRDFTCFVHAGKVLSNIVAFCLRNYCEAGRILFKEQYSATNSRHATRWELTASTWTREEYPASSTGREHVPLSTESQCGKGSHASVYKQKCLHLSSSFTTNTCGPGLVRITSWTRNNLTQRKGCYRVACCRRRSAIVLRRCDTRCPRSLRRRNNAW